MGSSPCRWALSVKRRSNQDPRRSPVRIETRKEKEVHADHQPAYRPWARAAEDPEFGSGSAGLSAEAWGLHARLYHDAEEAELGAAQGGDRMSRRHRADKREILPDAKFGDVVLSRFMNALMYDGKKSAAEGIVYNALDVLKRRGGAQADPIRMFHEALDNVKPAVEVRSRRVGGATYQVPVEVRTERRQAWAIRWIIDAARKRGEHTMQDRLSNELLDAVNNRGSAVKKREDTHRMAEANKAFSHYRW